MWPNLDLNQVLGEMSRLNGIMNIEAGVDGETSTNFYRKVRTADKNFTEQFLVLQNHYQEFTRYLITYMHYAICWEWVSAVKFKSGYLARMMARRTLRLRDDLD